MNNLKQETKVSFFVSWLILYETLINVALEHLSKFPLFYRRVRVAVETKAIHFPRQELLHLPSKPRTSKGTMLLTDLRRISLLCSEEILTANSVCDLNELECDGILYASLERVTFICSCLWIHGGITISTLPLICERVLVGMEHWSLPCDRICSVCRRFQRLLCHLSCNKMVMNISGHEWEVVKAQKKEY